MPIKPTLFSRVSIGWWNSGKSIADMDPADTGAVLSVTGSTAFGATAFSGAVTGTSTASFNGATTFQSTVSARGQFNADAGVQVGGGEVVQVISSKTAAISFGAIAPLESSSVITVALSGLSRNDALFITPDANWHHTAANLDVHVCCSSGSTSGEASVWAINSTLTSVTPTASSIFRLTRMKFGNYPAN